jgi:hypothetical protein
MKGGDVCYWRLSGKAETRRESIAIPTGGGLEIRGAKLIQIDGNFIGYLYPGNANYFGSVKRNRYSMGVLIRCS